MFDCHVHTSFSSDSEMNIEEAVKKSKEDNIGVIVTDHIDLKYPVKGEFIFNIKDYFNTYMKYRCKNILIGIELGMRTDCFKENEKIIKENNFDCVIGSIHVVDNMDIYEPEFYEKKTKKESYMRYFEDMLECINMSPSIDVLGHIDYIARYGRYDDKELYYNEYSEIIDEILKKIIQKGILLELNTKRIVSKSIVENLKRIYERYGELGGKFITIGSDAHDEASIGNNFNAAKEIGEFCNLKIVYLKNRKIEYI